MDTKVILSLDGGGIRGKFIADFLAHLAQAARQPIHQLFDLVVGVSSGAISAALIATHQDDFHNEQLVNPFEIFRSRSSAGLLSTMYTGVGKTHEINRLFGSRRMNSAQMPVVILTAELATGEPRTFTELDTAPLAAVVDASSAAPVYFPPIPVDGQYMIDGGVVNNDPVFAGIQHARQLWGPDVPLAVLSIGTGVADQLRTTDINPNQYGLVRWLNVGLIDILTASHNRPIVEMLVGREHYLRVTARTRAGMDDITAKSELSLDAGRRWGQHGTELLAWLARYGRGSDKDDPRGVRAPEQKHRR